MRGKASHQLQGRHHPQSRPPLPSSRRCSAGLLPPQRSPPSYLRPPLHLGPAPLLLLHKKFPVRRHLRHRDDCRDSLAQVRPRHLLVTQRHPMYLILGALRVVWPLSGGETLHFCTALCAIGDSVFGLSVRLLAKVTRGTVIQVQPCSKRRARLIYSENIDRTARTSCAQQRSLPCLLHRQAPSTQGCRLPRHHSHHSFLRRAHHRRRLTPDSLVL